MPDSGRTEGLRARGVFRCFPCVRLVAAWRLACEQKFLLCAGLAAGFPFRGATDSCPLRIRLCGPALVQGLQAHQELAYFNAVMRGVCPFKKCIAKFAQLKLQRLSVTHDPFRVMCYGQPLRTSLG